MRRVRFGNGNVVQPTLRLAHLGVAILGACLFAGCLSAQYTEECFVGSAPNTVRATGTTELLGDLVITCSGGVPTPSGMPIPMGSFLLSISANITGRLFQPMAVSGALLIIDEAFPAKPVPGSATPAPGAPPQILCAPSPSFCNETGTGGSPSPYQTQPNVFVGFQTGINQVAFNGIPIDAPGSGSRTYRITNIRANVSALGVGSGLAPVEIFAAISINGDAVLAINETASGILLGVAQNGFVAGISAAPAFSQCQPHNASLLGGSGTAAFDFSIRAEEGFPSAFRFRNYGTAVYGVEFPQQLSEQNVPGLPYDTESGFYSPSLFTSLPEIGLADFGTRVMVEFRNVAAGTHLFVPVGIVTKHPSCSPSTNCAEGYLRLVESGLAGGSTPGDSPRP